MTESVLEVPVWFVIILVGAAVAFGGWFGRLAYGEGSVLRTRNRALKEELDKAEAKIDRLRMELVEMEQTVRRLREDLQWERDQNRHYRDSANENLQRERAENLHYRDTHSHEE